MDPALSRHDIDILRHLAARKVELADSPANRERREAWYRLDAGAGDRPMVLIELGGLRDGSNPFDSIERACTSDWPGASCMPCALSKASTMSSAPTCVRPSPRPPGAAWKSS